MLYQAVQYQAPKTPFTRAVAFWGRWGDFVTNTPAASAVNVREIKPDFRNIREKPNYAIIQNAYTKCASAAVACAS